MEIELEMDCCILNNAGDESFCTSFQEALDMKLIERSIHHPTMFIIGQYWLPFEYCPWCGNQI